MAEWIQKTEGIWTYLVLFLLAAAPWLEVFVVIPVGLALGLNPITVAITGFIGNWIPILLIALFFRKLSIWRERRKERQRLKNTTSYNVSTEDNGTQLGQQEKKHRRARKVWEKYGVPGLCLLAPILVGTDIAMILALAFGSPRRPVTIWMTISLIAWTLVLTFGTLQGITFLH